MYIIPRHPCSAIGSHFSFHYARPYCHTFRNTSNISPPPYFIVFCVGFLASLEFCNHVKHPLAACCIACCCSVHGQSREIVPTYVPIQTFPVWKAFAFGC